jgi:hypothetical protein
MNCLIFIGEDMNAGHWIENWGSLQPKKYDVIFEGETFTHRT